jgi:hypothetical protein
MLSPKIVKDAQLKVYKGAPHGMCTTLKEGEQGIARFLQNMVSASTARITGP